MSHAPGFYTFHLKRQRRSSFFAGTEGCCPGTASRETFLIGARNIYFRVRNKKAARMFFDPWFLVGVLIYVVILLFAYLYSKSNLNKRVAQKPEDKDRILRWTIASLIFSVCILIFEPIWFPSGGNIQYDFYTILLLITTIASIFATYILIKRNK